MTTSDFDLARAAADAIARRHGEAPRVALILGSGLGGLAERIAGAAGAPATRIPYGAILGFPQATAAGHAGQLVLGRLHGVPIAAMQGRFHLYEGYTPQQVTLPVRALRLLGADTLIATNAAGGLDATLRPGDLLLLRDHIGLPTLSGLHPLTGANDERFGPRFPSLTSAYDAGLRTLARVIAAEQAIPLREGVYVMVGGPSYETVAEARFLRLIGADAVGMSTVPEVIAARHMGMRVLAVSCVTNVLLAADDATPEPNHAEVVAVAEQAGQRLATLVEGVLRRL